MSRLSIRIGEALLDWRGCDLTVDEVSALIDQVAAKAADIPAAEEEPEKLLIGFSAPVLERLPDELAEEPS